MPGGFHPFHPGHKSLYVWAVETFGKENVYVAATDDTKSRPFPFDVKQKLAAMAGVPTQRFMQVKSPFNALSYKDIIKDPENTALVFVRSEKDKTSHPLPDQVRKSDGMMGYLISYKDGDLETADTHGYIAYGPTINFDFSGMSIKSASELRAAWPEMSDEDKLQAAELMYPSNAQEATQLLNQALGNAETSVGEDASEDEEDEFHRKLDKLVHKTFGHSSDEKKKKKYKESDLNEALPAVAAAFATVGGLLLGGALAYQDSKLTQDWMEAYKEINLRDPDKAREIKKLVNQYKSLNIKNQGIKNLTREKIEKIIADANPKDRIKESDVVIDPVRLRQYLRMLIDDAIDKEKDIGKLSKVLKILVGKEIRSRGKRYAITSEDVITAFEANCKNRRRKVKESSADQMLKDFEKHYSEYVIRRDQTDSDAAMVPTLRQANYKMKQIIAAHLKKANDLEKQLKQMGYADKVQQVKANMKLTPADPSTFDKDI